MNIDSYIIYARKSSEQEEKQALSIESQVSELTQLAKRLKLHVSVVLSEAKSAKDLGRPVFSVLLSKIQSHESRKILVWHPDRLSRNPQDSASIVALLDSGDLLEVVTPTQTFRNNPMDKFMLGFFMMQAKFENDSKGVNVVRGLKAKAEKGWLPSGAKAGYMNDKFAEKGNKTILPDPNRFTLIRKAWDCMLTGTYTVMQILRLLNEDWGYRTPKHKRIGGKPMSRSQLYKTFTDEFYFGRFEYPVGSDNWYQGNHEQMITEEEFDRVQILLGRKGKPRPKTHRFPFTGLFNCGDCGAMVTAEEKYQIICSTCKFKFSSLNKEACPKCSILIEEMINPTRLHYTYYHCTKKKDPDCKQKSITDKELEKQIDEQLSKIQISERFKNWAIKYLNEINDKESEDRSTQINSLHSAYGNCIKRIDNLIKLKISEQNADEQLLSDTEFREQKEALLKEKELIKEKLGDSDDRVNKWVELTEKTFNLAVNARYWFANGDLRTKKQILVNLGQNLILKDQIVRINLDKPLNFIEMAIQEEPTILEKFEPEEKIDNTLQLEHLWAQNTSMLDPWNDFRTTNWSETVEYPELLIKESNQLLALYQ